MTSLAKIMSAAVMFDGGNKIFVGVAHHKKPGFGEELSNKLRTAANRYGVWYEGNGSDVPYLSDIFGNRSAYKGSWDDNLVAKKVSGYPIEFMVGLFSNPKENGMVKHFTDAKLTIFESLLKHQDGKKYFKDRSYDAKTLTAFLKEGSEKGKDFIALSRKPATKENLDAFFAAGEALTWPANWIEYPNKLGKLAKKFEDARNKSILREESGVFIVGKDHLKELRMLKGVA